jgi:hypothetical protein
MRSGTHRTRQQSAHGRVADPQPQRLEEVALSLFRDTRLKRHRWMLEPQQLGEALAGQGHRYLSSSGMLTNSSGSAVVYLICPIAKEELTSVRLILAMSFL